MPTGNCKTRRETFKFDAPYITYLTIYLLAHLFITVRILCQLVILWLIKIIIFYLNMSPTPPVKNFPNRALVIQRSFGHFLLIRLLWTCSGWYFLDPSRVSQNIHSGSSADKIERERHRSARYTKRYMATLGFALWPADVWNYTTVVIYTIVRSFHPGWQLCWNCAISNWCTLDLLIPNWSLTDQTNFRMRLVLHTYPWIMFCSITINIYMYARFNMELQTAKISSIRLEYTKCSAHTTLAIGVYQLCKCDH